MTARFRNALMGSILALAILPGAASAAVSVSAPETPTDATTGAVETLMFGAETPKLTEAATPGLAADVPEPASWVVMVLGCGLVGAYLRACRRLAA